MASPMLSRALGGAGTPGRIEVPGRAVSVVLPIDIRVSSTKWSVCGIVSSVAGGSAEYRVERCLSSSSSDSELLGLFGGLLDLFDDLGLLRLSPSEVAIALIEDLVAVEGIVSNQQRYITSKTYTLSGPCRILLCHR